MDFPQLVDQDGPAAQLEPLHPDPPAIDTADFIRGQSYCWGPKFALLLLTLGMSVTLSRERLLSEPWSNDPMVLPRSLVVLSPSWRVVHISEMVQKSQIRAKLPMDLSLQPDPKVKEYIQPKHDRVVYSLVINAHNRPHGLREVIASTAMTARGTFEIIFFCDGCNAQTLQVAEAALDEQWANHKDCDPHSIRKETDPHARLPNEFYMQQKSELNMKCGDAFQNQCGSMQRILLIDQATAIWETAANNRAALLSTGDFLVFMQDDMLMTLAGWNVQLSLPMRLYNDMFAVSGRCAHGWEHCAYGGDRRTVGRCGKDIFLPTYDWEPRARALSPISADLSAQIDTVFIRPTCNRGPLLYNRTKFERVGYFDEAHLLMGNDDHDINIRALEEEKFVSGFVPIQFHTLALDRNLPEMKDNGFKDNQEQVYKAWRKKVSQSVTPIHRVASCEPKDDFFTQRSLSFWSHKLEIGDVCGVQSPSLMEVLMEASH
mmetsp:Transcript_71044/g.141141  ORF Transcript_71044/g.141141 Transcript_71044/m.141141 type:complete len:488 (-) Transcript_71044:184-1647(-)